MSRQFNASWDAGRANRAFVGRSDSLAGPNRANSPYLPTLRARARDLVRNNPIASHAINLLVSETVGAGIVPRPMGENDTSKQRIRTLWSAWKDEADSEWLHDFYGLQALIARAWLESGEVFVRIRPRRLEDGLSVPMQLQVIEADQVALVTVEDWHGHSIIDGVEFDAIGRRVAYWLHPKHPGEWPVLQAGGLPALDNLVRVSADNIIHIFEAERPGQVRGVPRLARVLERLRQLHDFDQATLERQKLNAAMTLFIRRPAPNAPGTDPITGDPIDPDAVPASRIEAGMAYQLLPGEDVEAPDLPGLGREYEAFVRHQLQAVAAGLGIPYEVLTGDFANANDRTVRVAINTFRRRLQQIQKTLLIPRLCQQVMRHWKRMGWMAGALKQADLKTPIRWTPQAWQYIHPVQDVDATIRAIDAGLKSRTEALLEQGYDPEEVAAQLAEEQKIFSGTFPKGNSGGQGAQSA